MAGQQILRDLFAVLELEFQAGDAWVLGCRLRSSCLVLMLTKQALYQLSHLLIFLNKTCEEDMNSLWMWASAQKRLTWYLLWSAVTEGRFNLGFAALEMATKRKRKWDSKRGS